jgi:type I restriction enzyme S subunit
VAKLEKLLDQVEACQRRLAKVPRLLKRFRQAVLAAACSGRLTADWREENSATNTESAEDFPDGWSLSSFGDVLESLKYGTSTKCGYERRGAPVLRIPNIVSGKIDQTDLKFAELPARELNQLRLTPGDILLIRSNGSVSLVGRSAIVSEEQKGFAYAGYLIRLRPDRMKVEPEFLNLVLASYDIRLQIELEARSTSGVNNINSEEVRALHLLLPPPPEQREIVRRVESFFAIADRIEARFAEGQKRVDSITQAILAKAFRGELVPTEFELAKAEGRSFESEEELLKRIKGNGQVKQKTSSKRSPPSTHL